MAGPSPCRKTSAASICNYPWEGLAEGVSNDWLLPCIAVWGWELAVCPARSARTSFANDRRAYGAKEGLQGRASDGMGQSRCWLLRSVLCSIVGARGEGSEIGK